MSTEENKMETTEDRPAYCEGCAECAELLRQTCNDEDATDEEDANAESAELFESVEDMSSLHVQALYSYLNHWAQKQCPCLFR